MVDACDVSAEFSLDNYAYTDWQLYYLACAYAEIDFCIEYKVFKIVFAVFS